MIARASLPARLTSITADSVVLEVEGVAFTLDRRDLGQHVGQVIACRALGLPPPPTHADAPGWTQTMFYMSW